MLIVHWTTSSTFNLHASCLNKWYCQTSNISHTKSQHLNVSRLILQLSLPNPLQPGVKSRMKMESEQRRQAMLQLHLSDQQFYCLLRCSLYWRFEGMYNLYDNFLMCLWKRDNFSVLVQVESLLHELRDVTSLQKKQNKQKKTYFSFFFWNSGFCVFFL